MLRPVIIGNISDNPFAIDISHFCGQKIDISDAIYLKDFENTEFCPRFISDEGNYSHIGNYLKDRIVLIVSTTGHESRNSIAMKNMIIARAAKDNGAAKVVLIEPDLFYSCQDRGPKKNHTYFNESRKPKDRKKFDGQPFTALLYAQLLKTSGVDEVVTVHNHSLSTQRIFQDVFSGKFHNLVPGDLFAHYMSNSSITNPENIVLCAPDRGAAKFVDDVKIEFDITSPAVLKMDKSRSGERRIYMEPSQVSEISIEDVEGRDVFIFDDMVRTGTTIVKCCKLIKQHKPRKIVFCVTHFHSSSETREKLNHPAIDEIVTTNTIPSILNRDSQGRLRRKITVLKVERWIANYLNQEYNLEGNTDGKVYSVDISSKNPRWSRDKSF